MGLLGGKNLSMLLMAVIGFLLIGNTINFGVDAEKEIPMTKFGQNVGGPTMTFLYW